MSAAVEGYSQVLHIFNNRNHIDMNKIGGNAIRLKLTSSQPAKKKFADKHQVQGSLSLEPVAGQMPPLPSLKFAYRM